MTPCARIAPAADPISVTLRDGSRVVIRPVRREDQLAIRAFLGSLSRASVGFRFFGRANLDWASNWSVNVDDADRYGLVLPLQVRVSQ